MPIIEVDSANLEIEIPGVFLGMKRKAKLTSMEYNQEYKFLRVSFVISYYENLDGEYGEKISAPGITSYYDSFTANNTVIVNALTGEIVDVDSLSPEEIDSTPLMGQYDYFWSAANSTPLQVHEMLTDFMASAFLSSEGAEEIE